jgi:hypothetical protein
MTPVIREVGTSVLSAAAGPKAYPNGNEVGRADLIYSLVRQ